MDPSSALTAAHPAPPADGAPPADFDKAMYSKAEEGEAPVSGKGKKLWKVGGDSFTRTKKRRITRDATMLPPEELAHQRHGTWVSCVFHIITAVM